MGLEDTIGNKTEDLGGEAKEATGDDSRKNEDNGAQARGGLTEIAEQARDLFTD